MQPPDRAWYVFMDMYGWVAQHTTKKGLVTGADQWSKLFDKMMDAEQAYDAGMRDMLAARTNA